MTQEDEHYRENPSNHELLTERGVDRRAFLKMFRAQITVYYIHVLVVVEVVDYKASSLAPST